MTVATADQMGQLRYDAPRVRMTLTIREAQMQWESLDALVRTLPDASVHREECALLLHKVESAGIAEWGRGWWMAAL